MISRMLLGLAVMAWLVLASAPAGAQNAPTLPDRSVDPAAFESNPSVLTPKDIARIKHVEAAVVTPDGKHVAYTLSVQADPSEENVPASSQVWVVNVETGTSTPYATRGNARGLAVRPEHNTLTFIDQLGGDESASLYEVPLGGGEAVKRFSFDTGIQSYEWAPDGQSLAFVASDPDAEEMETDLPYQPEIYEEGLAYSFGYVAPMQDGAEIQKIALDRHVTALTWSPDGQRLAARSAPTPRVDDVFMAQQIDVIDASSLESVARVDHDAKFGPMTFSPDGSQLAFIAGADIHDPIDGRLFVVSAEGGEPTALLPSFEGTFDDVRWRDGETLEFLASEGVHATVGRMGADGSNLSRIVSGDGPVMQSLAFGGGTHAFVTDAPMHPREIYVLQEESDAPQRLTDHNPWLADESLAEQDVVTYMARDGRELQGLLIHPLNKEDGTRYPLITVVHGGPEAHYDDGWLTAYSMAGQMAAARGYAVFYPNYRGSTGRGVEFAKSSQGDLAGAEFDDIVDGVDALIDRGLVDEDHVGVTGGSYGGYATAWMATRYSDRFAAGVMFVGISNNISKWGESDIPEELYLVHARKRIWEDYQGYLERSPIYYADQAETPLLILHGKEDPRVHPSQSLELYRHVKTRTDTPVRLVFYPGEGHGNRSATARFDYNIRMLRWFDRYLAPGNQQIGVRE